MDITIRRATATDYSAIVAVGWQATADFGLTVEDLHFADQQRRPTIAGRLVAVTPAGEIIGTASYGQSAPAADPGKFNVWFHVLPHRQGEEIGKRLYNRVIAALAPHRPHVLETGVRSDLPRAVRFLQERGFAEVSRECETQLDLQTFDPEHFVADVERVEEMGIALKRLIELTGDLGRDAKLHALHTRHHEVGMAHTAPAPFAEWQHTFWQNPQLHPAAFAIAIDGEQYIGHSHALLGDASELSYGYTGVLPAYRNRGIARAMKWCVLAWAKAQGYTAVRSWSDSRNAAMIRVNLSLGFAVQPPVLWMEKGWPE
ncbi:MAG: GNAT family N-acetyltransferase [Caldilineaceae bacterium]